MTVLVRILMMDSCTKPKYEIIGVRIIFSYLLKIRIKLNVIRNFARLKFSVKNGIQYITIMIPIQSYH